MNGKFKKCVSMVLSAVVVFIFMTSPASAQTSEEQEFDLLGSLSAKYESNGNPGAISNGSGDAGGPSYGAYQFPSYQDGPRTFAYWLIYDSKLDPAVGWRLIDAYETENAYGENFNREWRVIASEMPDYFLKLQRAYVRTKYYDPAAASLRGLGFEIDNYSIAFKNVVWSRAVQHGVGGATNVFKRAFESIGGFEGKSEPELIRAVYHESGITGDYEGNKMYDSSSSIVRDYGLDGQTMRYFGGCSSAIQAGVWLRLNVNELGDALAMYDKYKDSVPEPTPSDRKKVVAATLAHITDGRTQVNIRTGPSTDSAVIVAKDGGTRLAIIGNKEGDWFPVRFESGGRVFDGYCHSDYVTIDFNSLTVLLGDADENGAVTPSDALMILQNSVGKIEFTAKQYYACNVDFVGEVTMADALMVLQMSAGVIDGF